MVETGKPSEKEVNGGQEPRPTPSRTKRDQIIQKLNFKSGKSFNPEELASIAEKAKIKRQEKAAARAGKDKEDHISPSGVNYTEIFRTIHKIKEEVIERRGKREEKIERILYRISKPFKRK